MPVDPSRHPCFNDRIRHRYGRIHLPVAPRCNIQCNFCNRSFDCANESRPGVTSAVVSPAQALYYLQSVLESTPNLSVVGIAGPGDPFANVDETLETLRLVRRQFPEMLLCVASNGLNVAPHAIDLASLEVSHVTLTINAVDPKIGAKIYAWVRDGGKVYRGIAAAELLIRRQLEAIRGLKARGVTVKINTILIPGVNTEHAAEVAAAASSLGADIANCIPIYPVAATSLELVEPPDAKTVAAIRAEVARHLPIMHHCTRCRADAVGLLGEPAFAERTACLKRAAAMPLDPRQDRPYVAVTTHEGFLVNQHLGEAEQVAIFEKTSGGFRSVGYRPAPPPGGGPLRWLELAERLHDCRAILTAGAGESPRAALARQGIRVVLTEGLIEEGLDAVYRGTELRAPVRKQHRCGTGCAGDGLGCQ